jgi:hypothetical protein
MEKFFLENFWVIILILIWTLPWKAAALWRAARRSHFVWFIVLLLFNTLAILDILYFFFFSKTGRKKKQQETETRSGTFIARSNRGNLI